MEYYLATKGNKPDSCNNINESQNDYAEWKNARQTTGILYLQFYKTQTTYTDRSVLAWLWGMGKNWITKGPKEDIKILKW